MKRIFTEDVLTKVIEMRGYLVLGSFVAFNAGDIIPCYDIFDCPTRQPFVVIESTDIQDWREQGRLLQQLANADLWYRPPHRHGFYRVTTD